MSGAGALVRPSTITTVNGEKSSVMLSACSMFPSGRFIYPLFLNKLSSLTVNGNKEGIWYRVKLESVRSRGFL